VAIAENHIGKWTVSIAKSDKGFIQWGSWHFEAIADWARSAKDVSSRRVPGEFAPICTDFDER